MKKSAFVLLALLVSILFLGVASVFISKVQASTFVYDNSVTNFKMATPLLFNFKDYTNVTFDFSSVNFGNQTGGIYLRLCGFQWEYPVTVKNYSLFSYYWDDGEVVKYQNYVNDVENWSQSVNPHVLNDPVSFFLNPSTHRIEVYFGSTTWISYEPEIYYAGNLIYYLYLSSDGNIENSDSHITIYADVDYPAPAPTPAPTPTPTSTPTPTPTPTHHGGGGGGDISSPTPSNPGPSQTPTQPNSNPSGQPFVLPQGLNSGVLLFIAMIAVAVILGVAMSRKRTRRRR